MSHTVSLRQILCLVLAAVIALLLLGSPAVRADESSKSSQTSESAKQDAKDKVDELQQQLNEEKEALKQTQKKGKDAEAAKKSYQAQSRIVAQQISELAVTLDETQAAISQKQTEVDAKQAEIDERWESFKDQMAAMQMMNDAGFVAMLPNVQSLYELLTFADVLQQISQKQNEVLEDMTRRRDELQAVQDELEAKKEELEVQQKNLDAKKSELVGSIQKADSTISEAEAQAQAQQVQVEATAEALRKAQAEFNSMIGSLPNSGAPFVGEEFVWPTVSSRITQHFGHNGHGGTDIGATSPGRVGDPIYAAASGTVQVSAYHQHTYSYGNYVVIDHGGGIKTLYAHLNSSTVSAGQTVSQGQVIGYMGNSGYSFGAHLHFEVRVNGSRVNPMGYYHRA